MRIIKSIGVMFGCLVLVTTIFSVQPKWAVANEQKMALNLDGSKWAIETTLVEKNGKTSTSPDILIFEDNQFSSEEFRKDGYEPTNYSVSLNSDGSTKFGTMQNKDSETAYWEGQINEEKKMNGTIYIYSKKAKGVKKEYYFNGNLISGDLKRLGESKAVAEETVKSPASTSGVKDK